MVLCLYNCTDHLFATRTSTATSCRPPAYVITSRVWKWCHTVLEALASPISWMCQLLSTFPKTAFSAGLYSAACKASSVIPCEWQTVSTLVPSNDPQHYPAKKVLSEPTDCWIIANWWPSQPWVNPFWRCQMMHCRVHVDLSILQWGMVIEILQVNGMI